MRNTHSPVHYVKARPRLFGSLAVFTLLMFVLPADWRISTRFLVAWDTATGLYLIMAMWMMAHSTIEKIRLRAALQDEGRFAVLLLTVLTALASLAAIVAELATSKSLEGLLKFEHIGLAGITVFLSWSFMQTIFALHYAHEYFQEKRQSSSQSLDFPGDEVPDYWDFMYFSIVIGAAAQTADVNIGSKIMRRLVTIHCIVAFVFNTTILALTVNIGASLF